MSYLLGLGDEKVLCLHVNWPDHDSIAHTVLTFSSFMLSVPGSAYFKCDHQRSVYLFMNSINRTCDMIAYPCESYTDFLDGKCMGCDKFQGEGCPVLGKFLVSYFICGYF